MTTSAAAQPVVLDVRTPEEFDEGRLDGAKLIDFLGGEVHSALSELDPTAEYLVYCKSGGRSGHTVQMMQNAGFTSATNLGSLEEAAEATGIQIVR
ncbi:MAG: rhodanese-like domain-containing protein [Leucobacter sp.]